MSHLTMSAAEYEAHQRKRGKQTRMKALTDGAGSALAAPKNADSPHLRDSRERPAIKGQLRKRKGPNKTEAAFCGYLTLGGCHQLVGLPRVLGFEAMTLQMPGGTRYTPDWPAMTEAGQLCFFETKGWMREAARVRLKEFAAHFTMFKFYLVRAKNRALTDWSIQEIS